jgi:hypothetical protein
MCLLGREGERTGGTYGKIIERMEEMNVRDGVWRIRPSPLGPKSGARDD